MKGSNRDPNLLLLAVIISGLSAGQNSRFYIFQRTVRPVDYIISRKSVENLDISLVVWSGLTSQSQVVFCNHEMNLIIKRHRCYIHDSELSTGSQYQYIYYNIPQHPGEG